MAGPTGRDLGPQVFHVLRLLLYAKGFPPRETGGPVEVAFHLVRGLLRHPEVHLTLVAQTDSSEDEIRGALQAGGHLVVLRLPYYPTLREVPALRPVVTAIREADLVHFNEFPFRHLPLVLFAKARGVPIVFSLHGLVSREIHTFLGPAYRLPIREGRDSIRMPGLAIVILLTAYRWFSRAWTAVVTPSEALKRAAATSEAFDAARIIVIPHGVEVSDSVPGPPVPRDGTPRILFVGKLEEIKGPDLLLGALELLSADGTSLDVTFVGAGSLEDDLRSRAARLAPHRVTFLGVRRGKELESLYAAADIVVIPSRWESLSLVALEAMAAGRPILATNVGGLPEVLGDSRNGILVPPDAASLASGLRRLLVEPRTREAMRVANLAEARRRPWSGVAARYLRLYADLVRPEAPR